MPIVIECPEWSQKEDEVRIILPLNNVHPNQISDILIAEKFVKVNYSPYYFEAFLLHEIDAGNSKCKIYENYIKLVLKKRLANVIWDHFECGDTKHRHGIEKLDVKKGLLHEHDANVAAEIETNRKMKSDFKRHLIDLELNRDQKKREQIDEIDQLIKGNEQKEISELIAKEAEMKHTTIGKSSGTIHASNAKSQATKASKRYPKIPSIRKFATIDVNFSERRFVTPQRESQEATEQEWILKQSKIKTDLGFNDDDLTAEERNPKWLLDKGNEFFRKKNYKAAISAYSTGINIAEEPAMLLLNRAVAHFHLENYERCATDTSKAYDLFVPVTQANSSSRIRCLSLRGAALIKLGFLKQGHQELKAAKELDPRNEQLQQDIDMVECALRSSI